MATLPESFDVPYRNPLIERSGMLTTAWTNFFRSLFDRLLPLGAERSCQIANNQSGAADVVGLKVNARAVSQAVVDYLIQRVTTSTGATELVESGIFILAYRPTDEDWDLSIVSEETPDDAGVDFSVTADGQVQYTSSDITGTPSISRVLWRMRTLAGKSTQYSSQGTR